MYYDEETKVYQDDKGIFIHRKRLDDTGKYVYAGDTPVCRFALDEQWSILVRCEIQENCFSIQLLKGKEIHHSARAETLDMLKKQFVEYSEYFYASKEYNERRKKMARLIPDHPRLYYLLLQVKRHTANFASEAKRKLKSR